MKAEVKEGKLAHIQGDEGNPDSQGFLCVRGRAAEEIIGNDQRLLYPLARDSRDSQDWRRVSWDDVLDRIANAMANAGGDRVGIWPGHGNGSNDYAVGVKSQLINRFAKMFGAQSWNPTMICWGWVVLVSASRACWKLAPRKIWERTPTSLSCGRLTSKSAQHSSISHGSQAPGRQSHYYRCARD